MQEDNFLLAIALIINICRPNPESIPNLLLILCQIISHFENSPQDYSKPFENKGAKTS